MFRKILIGIAVVLFLLIAGVLVNGLLTPATFEGSKTATVNHSCNQVFQLLNDREATVERRREVSGIKDLGHNEKGLPIWEETMDMGESVQLEMIERIQDQLVAVEMTESDFGMTGVWTYEMAPTDGGCEVTVAENSDIENFWVRVAYGLSGRDYMLGHELQYIEQYAGEY